MNAARPVAVRSKLDVFVRGFGVEALARRLGIHSSAIWHWIDGSTSPHPANAVKMQTLAKERGVELSLEDVYQHSYVPATPKSSREASSRARTPATVRPSSSSARVDRMTGSRNRTSAPS